MTVAELAQLLSTMPPEAVVTVAAHRDPCVDCGSDGHVLAVTLDRYEWYNDKQPEVTLEYGTPEAEPGVIR